MKISVNNSPMAVVVMPKNSAIIRIIKPCINAVVAPPSVRPIIIENLLIGATNTSCKKPNCLSQRTDIPVNIDENSIAIATIPGAKKFIYSPSSTDPIDALLKPDPSMTRKNIGCIIIPITRLFDLIKRFICLSHMT